MQPFVCSSRWLAATLSPEALIASLSSGAEQFTGYSAQELVGRPITQILTDDSAFEMPRILALAREWGYWEGEIVHRTRGGKSLEARSAVTLLAGKGNRADGFLFVSNLNKSLALKEGDQSVVTDIATTLRAFAHDLNNPLAVIMGFTQLLVLNSGCQGKVRADIEKLYSELKRVNQVVERLHDYAISLYDKRSSDSQTDATSQSA
ncbi:MAG: PAS domain S-box protein [Acidobacteria bacterium]|nr:PAS domain S-box protein [Acidobacteriota bacterium]